MKQAEYDLMHRGLKAQMKYANKIHATYVLVLGGNELEQQSAKLKQMETGERSAQIPGPAPQPAPD